MGAFYAVFIQIDKIYFTSVLFTMKEHAFVFNSLFGIFKILFN